MQCVVAGRSDAENRVIARELEVLDVDGGILPGESGLRSAMVSLLQRIKAPVHLPVNPGSELFVHRRVDVGDAEVSPRVVEGRELLLGSDVDSSAVTLAGASPT